MHKLFRARSLAALSLATLTLTLACDRAPVASTSASPVASTGPAAKAEGPSSARRESPEERVAALALQRSLAEARTSDERARFFAVEQAAAAALAKHPGSRSILQVRVSALLAIGRARDALVDARALAADPDDAIAAGLLADALIATGDIDGAVVAVEKMMDLGPGLPAYARAALLRHATGDVDGSIEMWREAFLAGHKSAPEGLAFCATGLADALWSKGKLAAAMKSYDTALASVPTFPKARIGRARVHLAAGRTQEALANVDAIDERARTAESAALRASIRGALGTPPAKDALRDELASLAERDPTEAALALAAHRLDLPLARTLAERTQRDAGGLLDEAVLAYVVSRDGAHAQAAVHATKAVASGTADARVLVLAALALAHERPSDARALLARVPTVAIDPALAADVKSALASLPR